MRREQHNMTIDDDGKFRCTICGRTGDEPDNEMIGECKKPFTFYGVKFVGFISPDGVIHLIDSESITLTVTSLFGKPKQPQTPEERGADLLAPWVENEGREVLTQWIGEEGSDE